MITPNDEGNFFEIAAIESLFKRNGTFPTPLRRQYSDHVETIVALGKDEVATITITKEAALELGIIKEGE